jgi:hypothetical protein
MADLNIYTWYIRSERFYTIVSYGVIASSVEEARELVVKNFHRDASDAGVNSADIEYVGPFTFGDGCFDKRRFTLDDLMKAIREEPTHYAVQKGASVLVTALDG